MMILPISDNILFQNCYYIEIGIFKCSETPVKKIKIGKKLSVPNLESNKEIGIQRMKDTEEEIRVV